MMRSSPRTARFYSKTAGGLVFLLCICTLTLVSCSKRAGIIDLSNAPLLPVDSSWAVIVDPYAIYRSEPNQIGRAHV